VVKILKVKELRNAVLQLAIQGILVPQDPSDEPASVCMLKAIENHKIAISEKKIRNEKILDIDVEKLDFSVPIGWECTRLTYLCKIENGSIRRGPFGSAITKSMFVKKGENTYKVYEQGNAIRKTTEYGDYYISESHFNKLSAFEVKSGDVIISCAGTIGETYVLPKDMPRGIINQALMKISLNNEVILTSFFLILFNATQKNLNRDSKGSAMKNLASLKYLKNDVVFSIPPIEEQQRIVEKIEEIMPLIDEYEKFENQLTKLEDEFPTKLKKSILQFAVQAKLVEQNKDDEPAFVLLKKIKAEKEQLIKDKKIKKQKELPPITDEEKPFDIPESWEWVRLEKLSNNIHYGFNASAQPTGNSRLLRITDIQNNSVNWSSVPYCDTKEKEYNSYGLNNRDIMIARTGGTIGKSYIVRNLNEKVVFASYLIRVVPSSFINEHYIKYFLESPLYWEQLKDKSMGTGQPNVNGTSLKSLVLPLPTIEEQKRIVDKVDSLIKLCDIISDQKALAGHKFKPKKDSIIELPTGGVDIDNIEIAARGNGNKSDLDIANEIFEKL
jgi:type I restriction enzyme, S subunit